MLTKSPKKKAKLQKLSTPKDGTPTQLSPLMPSDAGEFIFKLATILRLCMGV